MDNVQGTTEITHEAPVAEQTPNVQTDATASEATEGGTAITFEELAAKKGFKTPDDLAKAYANIESHSTKVAQEKADLEKQFFNDAPKEIPTSPKLNAEEQALAELRSFMQKEAVEPLKRDFEEKLSRIELRQVIKENPDFGKFAEGIKDLKGKYPNMSFGEAYTVAKALKGDLAKEARAEGMKQSVEAVQRQGQAQVVPEKKVAENKIAARDLLHSAGTRWAANNQGQVDQRTMAEIEAVEKDLFGTILQKTPSGL